MKAWEEGCTGISPLILNVGGEWLTSRPGRFTHGDVSPYPLNRGLGEPQSQSKHCREKKSFLPLSRFELGTVQPVA